MIVLILGKDIARAGERELLLDGAPQREMLFGEEASPHALLSLSEGASLFGDLRSFGITGAAEDDGWLSQVIPHLASLEKSPHLFIFEEEANAPFAKAVEKAKGKVIKAKAEKAKEKTDTFALANALGSRDKKKVWLLYTQALQEGAPAEMLAGMLAWKARSMVASENTGRVPLGWKPGESKKLSSAIVSLYHDSRRGAGSLELLLEQFILSL
jgi:hypothetical protein